ncbi:MAG: carboxypeptidase-like regulatory domain-containing protein, partial [Candidatus Sumerlaeota bacterium]|nr:carboxypeptidase-like regulatory domain-containing protein [Candidatus Sumerlaeota bacterium]
EMKDYPPPPVFAVGERAVETRLVMQNLSTAPQGRTVVFEGCVSTSEGLPIAGAAIYWNPTMSSKKGKFTQSGADGHYRLETIKPQNPDAAGWTYEIAAYAPGYSPWILLQNDGGTTQAPKVINITMEKAHWVGGVVVNAKGAPLTGAGIKMNYIGRSFTERMLENKQDASMRTRTDADGKFRFEDIPQSRIVVTIIARGLSGIQRKNLPLDCETRFVLQESGVIKGRVVDEASSAPISAFTIKVSGRGRWDEHAEYGTLFNDAGGAFTCYDLDINEPHYVTAMAPGFIPTRREGAIASAEADAQPILIPLSRGAEVRGVVFDAATQKPIEGALVAVLFLDNGVDGSTFASYRGLLKGNYGDSLRYLTGPDGAFSFIEGDCPSPIAIWAKDYARAMIEPRDRERFGGLRSLRIGFRPAGAVRGTVTLAGKPLGNISIYSQYKDAADHSIFMADSNDGRTKTAADGSYRVDGLLPGKWEISAISDAKGMPFRSVALAAIPEGGEAVADISAVVQPGVLIGHVFAGKTPVNHAEINTVPLRPNAEGWSQTEYTNAKGEYRVEGLEEGGHRVTVSARSNGATRSVEETVQIKGETQKDFILPEEHKVTFKAVFDGATDPAGTPKIERATLSFNYPPGSEDSGKIDREGTCNDPKSNQMEFTGRFKGGYTLTIRGNALNSPPFYYQPSEPLALDNLAADQDLGEIHIPSADGASFSGSVRRWNGNPIPKVEIALTLEPKDGQAFSCKQVFESAEGRFQFLGLREGAYWARVGPWDGSGDTATANERVEVKGRTERNFVLLPYHKLTARLVPSPGGTRTDLLRDIRISLSLADGREEEALRNPLQISPSRMALASNGQIAFMGRFLGQYSLSLKLQGDVPIPGTFMLDTTEHDQDLGDITLPAMGAIAVRITYPPSVTERPAAASLLLMPEPPPASPGAPSGQTQQDCWLDPRKPEQEIRFIPEGAYRATLKANGWKSEPAAIRVTAP